MGMTQEERLEEDKRGKQKTLDFYLEAVREKKIYGGLEHNGMDISTGDVSQIRITNERLEALSNPDYTINWKARNGVFELNAQEMIDLGSALRDHIQKCMNTYLDLRNEEIEVEDIKNKFEELYSK